MVLGPGERGVGPPGVSHEWWNPSNYEEARFLVGIRPGLEVESMFEKLLGVMREGRTVGILPRNLLQLAVLACESGGWLVLSPVEKALFAPVSALALVGGLFGLATPIQRSGRGHRFPAPVRGDDPDPRADLPR